MMVSENSWIKAVDADLVKVKSSEKTRVSFVFPHPFKHYPRDFILKLMNLRYFSYMDSGDS